MHYPFKLNSSLVFIIPVLFILTTFGQQYPEMQVVSDPKQLSNELIDNNLKDANGRVCAGVIIESDLQDLVFNSNNGIIKMNTNPGKYFLFLSEDERVIEIYKLGYMPLSIILPSYGIFLESGKVFQFKISVKSSRNLIPVTIVTTPSDAHIYLDQSPVLSNVIKHVEIGNHRIIALKDGYEMVDETITVSEDKKLFLFQMKPHKNLSVMNTADDRIKKNEGMVFIPGGEFRMGSDEIDAFNPIRIVTVEDFLIDRLEITNKKYADFLNSVKPSDVGELIDLDGKLEEEKCRIVFSAGNYSVESGYDDYPVIFVSWYGANEYCKWANKRLPTEIEWEYAASALLIPDPTENEAYLSEASISRVEEIIFKSKRLEGDEFDYAGSDNINEIAWYEKNSGNVLHNVAQLKPNLLTIFDMSGNVREWCSDNINTDSADIINTKKIIRGGAYNQSAENCRIFHRAASSASSKFSNLGFRCAK